MECADGVFSKFMQTEDFQELDFDQKNFIFFKWEKVLINFMIQDYFIEI
ncbi:unnamed protein product [Paramecium sonneborni]|uniref:Uncharacterized protein n=1 Tax=Paramecium sonneborni TaxID=65129 RepID=A0A8S1RQD5_9CILI|nr:unnamed protein product [Paramecium sonneborni]